MQNKPFCLTICLFQAIKEEPVYCFVLLSSGLLVIIFVQQSQQKLFLPLQHVFLAKHAFRDLWGIPAHRIPDIFRRIPRWVDKQCPIYFTELQRAGEFERLLSSDLQWPSGALLHRKLYSVDQYAARHYQLHFGRFLVFRGAFLQVNRHVRFRKKK